MSDVQAFNYGIISSVISQLGKGVELPESEPLGFQFIVEAIGGQSTEFWRPAGEPIYDVDWGDGTKSQVGPDAPNEYDFSHAYEEGGEYTITITNNGPNSFIRLNDTVVEILTPVLRGLMPDVEYLDNPDFSYNPTNTVGLVRQASRLRSICGNFFKNYADIRNLSWFFSGNTALKTVPDNLLEGCTELESVMSLFDGCSALEFVPETLLSYSPKIQYIQSMFRQCPNLHTVPWPIFDNAVQNMISSPYGDYANFKGFTTIFWRCPLLQGVAPDWWNIAGFENRGGGCFTDCTSLTNYMRIPPWWGGGASGAPGSYD